MPKGVYRNPKINPETGKQIKGFAVMDPDRQREIAAKGGRTGHEIGKSHEFTSDEAREAGRIGGLLVSQDREHMSRIGRLGGSPSHKAKGE